jgi:hypothetical protein
VNVIRFSMDQNASKEIFFEDHERVFVFWFNQLIDGSVYKLFRAERHDLI